MELSQIPNQSAERLLPPAVVYDRTSLRETTVWRMVKGGNFPKPVRLSPGRIAWPESAINAWIAARVAEAA